MTGPRDGPENCWMLAGPIPLNSPASGSLVCIFHLADPESTVFLDIFPAPKYKIHPQMEILFLFLPFLPSTANFGLHWKHWVKASPGFCILSSACL